MLVVNEHDPNSWRLFIDSSKLSLKRVLLHNTSKHASIPNMHSTTLQKMNQPIKQELEQIKYVNHSYVICVGLKKVNFPLAQKSG